SEAGLLIYHTTPRFEAWVRPELPKRLELHLGRETKARTVGWDAGDTFKLNAPILSSTIEEVLNKNRCAQVESALKAWIGYDLENLFRIRSGLPHFRVPMEYETNKTEITGWSGRTGPFSEELLRLAHGRLNELLNHLTTHYQRHNDLVSAALM